eukprot:gene11692-biopygen9371
MSYLRLRGNSPGHLFTFKDGSPLTKAKINAKPQSVLQAASLQGRFKFHSLHVGAATTGAAVGFPEYLIKALGRWSSDAYHLYIKLPKDKLIHASRKIAAAPNQS